MLKQGCTINGQYVIVEIATNRKSVWIKIFNLDSPDSAEIEIPYFKARLLLGSDTENWERLLSMLGWEKGTYVLDWRKKHCKDSK
jgi:hypothetical protein